MRLLRVVVVLALLALAGLAGYAYFGDMAPDRREMRVPVSLSGEALPTTPAPAADMPAEAAAPQSAATDDEQAAGTDDLD